MLNVSVRTLLATVVFLSVLGIGAPSAPGDPAPQPMTCVAGSGECAPNRIGGGDKTSRERFAGRWRRSRSAGLRVVLIGDSHIQIGRVTRALRTALNKDLGNGGYGLLFPYSIANTYSPSGLKSSHEGSWSCGHSRSLPPKVPLGIVGTSCVTKEHQASFTIRFDEPPTVGKSVLRVFYQQQDRPFSLEVVADKTPVRVQLAASDDALATPAAIEIPRIERSLTVRFLQPPDDDLSFELHGLSLESKGTGGATLFSAGTGGAQIKAPLFAEYFEKDLLALHPDMIIVDYGTNDILYKDVVEPDMQEQLRAVVERIRRVAPDALIVLTSAQDLFYKGENILSGAEFSAGVRRVAVESGCALWDWFWISGGPRSLRSWRDQGLARKDLVHLTKEGYDRKGLMLYEALRKLATEPSIEQ